MMSPYLTLPIILLALGVAGNPLPEEIRPPPTSKLTKPCTTYITKIIGGAYRPETVYTVYTATETVFSLVPCKGCVLATTTLYAPGVGGGWPYDGTTTTTTAAAPFKTTSTICIPSHRPILPTILRQIRKRDDNLDPDLKISANPPPTGVARKTKTKGQNCPEYTFSIPTSTDSITKPVITLPGAGRTNPIEPTTTYAILRARETLTPPNLDNLKDEVVVQAIVTTTITLTSKSWSTTTTSTKYTTCSYGPYQDPDPGAIPRAKRGAGDVEVDNKGGSPGCSSTSGPPPPPTKTTVYKTIVIPETGTLTRTTVKCTKTVLTRRPRPTLTLDARWW